VVLDDAVLLLLGLGGILTLLVRITFEGPGFYRTIGYRPKKLACKT